MITHNTLKSLKVNISEHSFNHYCSVVPNAQATLERMIDPQARNTPKMIADAIECVPRNDARGGGEMNKEVDMFRAVRNINGSFKSI